MESFVGGSFTAEEQREQRLSLLLCGERASHNTAIKSLK
jgi:hypothetical protein